MDVYKSWMTFLTISMTPKLNHSQTGKIQGHSISVLI